MSWFMELFGCASDPTGKDAAAAAVSAISPEDEASEKRGLDALRAKLEARGASEAAVAAFVKNYEAMAGGDTGIIGEDEIEAIRELPDLKSVRCGPGPGPGATDEPRGARYRGARVAGPRAPRRGATERAPAPPLLPSAARTAAGRR